MTRQKVFKSLKVGSLFLLLGASAAVPAQSQPEDIIKYRRNVMKSNGAHAAAAGAILQGKVDYKNQLADHAKALENVNKDIPSIFPKGTESGDTRALPAVWDNRAEFEKRANEAKQKSAEFAKAAMAGDTQTAAAKFKELGEACKSCHKDFRKEEKEK